MTKYFKQIIVDDLCEKIQVSKLKKTDDQLYIVDYVSFYRSELADAFEKYGWSFVQSLGACLRYADHINAKRLIESFEDYVILYAFWFIKPQKKNA